MGDISNAIMERDFAAIVAAAEAGERCPASRPHGPLHPDAVQALVRAGRVRSEIFGHNWRVVTILVGEHAGKSTAHNPRLPAGAKAYLVDGKYTESAIPAGRVGKVAP